MNEVRINRFLQFLYPTLIFLTLVLSWNTVGQAGALTDSKTADFKLEPLKDRSPSIQLSCSRDGSDEGESL